MTIKPAKIVFNQHGTPFANQFDDIYFSNQSGLLESQFVFLENNALPQRWLESQQSCFVVAETGFGTGLNFLTCWSLFEQTQQLRQDARQHGSTFCPRLHFISVEKYPLSKDDLAETLKCWPELAEFSQALLAQYPPLLGGCHRLVFDNVILDLWFGDIAEVLPQWYCTDSGLVDAWFLDGFAPGKNPQMWSDALFTQMARLAKPKCTFATFTAAGFVRRGLQQAGFEVKKVPGFGSKREMLAGTLTNGTATISHAPYFDRSCAAGKHVAIIGAGLAGANLAVSLKNRGYQVDVYCADQDAASGASGNRQGGFYPQLHVEQNNASLLQAQCFGFALRRYQMLLKTGYAFAHQFCGVLQLAFNDAIEQRYRKMRENDVWPTELIRSVNDQQAEQIANIPLPYSGLYIPDGGWIHLPQLIQALLAKAQTKVITQHQLRQLTQTDKGWILHWQDQAATQADIVILATGHNSIHIQQLATLPLRPVRGQVENITTQPPLDKLDTVLCHKGYLTPAYNGKQALGSTYIKNDLDCDYRREEQHTNLAVLRKALAKCDWAATVSADNQGRAAIRCSTPDHLPVMGQVPDTRQQQQQYQDLYKALPLNHYPLPENYANLFCLTGLGSRGLCSAPLLAETLACQISGQPLPLSQTLLDGLNPNRFLVRALQRREI
ncbi:bifunctional tRNA (5-methylaminomethyl-2-thiouridine)(34)-methyltransferase MnmD/FAD-dependent 5-carboxymethylaminomethyl-2-thiouridine(34) oxidoreductase MnmC [Neptunicella sp. SCSIO 80796]|uniref:bifunctional tRNA (5-methylaminomethyl-2-thiouridine)(34)-methyltransferase MnmD/FAD-dependent 5-carboxymethylaminomethyl-2-thiouridine(34) oxidoreductase MnmC n=1 Tax=Neptunicella plasticusilytica TaxID=3117012 RepID=UPI003A4DC920